MKTYIIDWDKVQTLEDVKILLKSMSTSYFVEDRDHQLTRRFPTVYSLKTKEMNEIQHILKEDFI